MKKIIVLMFTSLFATTNFSMLQKHTAKPNTVKLPKSNPQSDLLTTKLISDPEGKQKRNDKVDIILKDYNRGLVHSLAASTITGATVYAATRALPVLSDYSVSSAAWTGAHVGILTHMIHATGAFSRLSKLTHFSTSKTKINGINELLLGVVLSIAMLNSGSFMLAMSDINWAFGIPTIYATCIGLGYAAIMHDEIHELATQIKSMSDSDPSPNDDNY